MHLMKDQVNRLSTENRALRLDRNVAIAVSKGIRVFFLKKNPTVKFFG